MRTENEIFRNLHDLCVSPGYVHAIAYLCYLNNSAPVDDLNNVIVQNRLDQLVRNEISTLIGLMIKGDISFDPPSLNVLNDYVNQTKNLLAEMHNTLSTYLTMGDMLRENIFYGSESAYTFQYSEMSPSKYESDDQWLRSNKSFSIQDVRIVYLAVEAIQYKKLRGSLSELQNVTTEDLTFLLSAFAFNIEDIASSTSISKSTIAAVLDAFTLLPDERNCTFSSLQEFNLANAKPILKMQDGEYVLFQIGSLAESMYESPCYWLFDDELYKKTADRNRGEFTEEICRARLELVFGEKNVFKNIKIYSSEKNVVGEIDVLVIFGGRAIVLQAKSKRLTIEARKGQDGHIQNDFKKSVQDAYDQGLSCANMICEKKYIKRSGNNKMVNIPDKFKEIYILCVVANHYPSLHFQARQFLKYETTEIIQPPMVLDIFAIDVITEMLQSPLYFLSYINRRVNYTNEIIATNELVILGFHLSRNLCIKNADIICLDDALAAALDSAMAVRRLGEKGSDTPPGILNRLDSTPIKKIIEYIERKDNPAEIDLGFLLLSLSEQTLLSLNESMVALVNLWRKNKRTHDFTIFFDSNVGLTIHCSKEPENITMINLKNQCERRKYFHKVNKWFGMCINPDGLSLRFCLVIDLEWQHNDEMDRITRDMAEIGQIPARPSSKRQKRKIGRNEPCPCGSGRKYKKCCLK